MSQLFSASLVDRALVGDALNDGAGVPTTLPVQDPVGTRQRFVDVREGLVRLGDGDEQGRRGELAAEVFVAVSHVGVPEVLFDLGSHVVPSLGSSGRQIGQSVKNSKGRQENKKGVGQAGTGPICDPVTLLLGWKSKLTLLGAAGAP